MEKKIRSILICGVGGQGIITSGSLIANVLLEAGFDVKTSEVHGMSQRGGDIVSTVRFGEQVFAPLASMNQVDYILSFELLETLRYLDYLADNGVVIVNDFEMKPLPVLCGLAKYPENIKQTLQNRVGNNCTIVPANDTARQLGDLRVSNIVLVGTIAAKIGLEKELWLKYLKRRFPADLLARNIAAFETGFAYS